MYLDIYALQSLPPSNVNRDDTGSPKTAWYGGAMRARVSSQCWKRAIRKRFEDILPEESLGVRSKFVVELLADKIAKADPSLAESSHDLAAAALKIIDIKTAPSKRKGSTEGKLETEYLVFISNAELQAIADLVVGWCRDGLDAEKPDKDMKAALKALFHGYKAVDLALFGRMLANATELNSDACCQVAHAISVDKVQQEYDYYTAIDDLGDEDNRGAAMIDTTPFTSGLMYRYATVNVDHLAEELGDHHAAATAAAAFVDAFATSMPAGKRNAFANNTYPTSLVVALRDGRPVNPVGAFEDPVRATPGRAVSEVAKERLAARLIVSRDTWGATTERAWLVDDLGDDSPLTAFAESTNFSTLIVDVQDTIETSLEHR